MSTRWLTPLECSSGGGGGVVVVVVVVVACTTSPSHPPMHSPPLIRKINTDVGAFFFAQEGSGGLSSASGAPRTAHDGALFSYSHPPIHPPHPRTPPVTQVSAHSLRPRWEWRPQYRQWRTAHDGALFSAIATVPRPLAQRTVEKTTFEEVNISTPRAMKVPTIV